MRSVEVAGIPAGRYVSSSSRRLNSRVLYYDESRLLTFETYKRRATTFASTDQFAVVPPPMQYRPDLVSQKFYGMPDLWWRIMEANQIWDVYDFKAGITIRLPTFTF